jgi:hypothetical protein
MNRKWWTIAAAFALLMTAIASAQTSQLKADVPFDFIVNGFTLPAGEYTLQSVDSLGKALSIRSSDSQAASTIIAEDQQSPTPSRDTRLVFHRYGELYFLAEIWMQGEDIGRHVPASAREKEMALKTRPHELVVMSARR